MSILLGLVVAYIINSSGPVSFGPGINAINQIFLGHDDYNMSDIAGHVANVSMTFLAGCPGGLIIPCISIGSYLGYIYHKLTDIGLYQLMLIGISSFLSAYVGHPLTSSVLTQNLFKQSTNIYPLLCISSIISYLTYYILEKKYG
jgi:H+/Cl- antiporter ClcA